MVKEDSAPYQHPQTGPRPRRFLLRSFSTSGPHRLYLLARGQANLLFQSSCFNVLVALSPLSLSLFSISHSLSLSFSFSQPPSASSFLLAMGPRRMSATFGAPRKRERERVGPDVPFTAATKRTAQASADLPGSHFRLGGNVHPRHTQPHLRHGVIRRLLSISLIAGGFKFSDGDLGRSRSFAPFVAF